MKPHHLLSQLLVLAAALSAVVLWAVVEKFEARWPEAPALMTLGAALGQVALAAAWVAWGRWNVALRVGLLLAVVLGWHYPVTKAMLDDYQFSSLWGGLLLLYALFNLLPFLLTRAVGFEMCVTAEPLAKTSARKWWQFTVGGVLTLTTLAAMILGAGRQVDFQWPRFVETVAFCLVAAFGGSAAVICAFWTRPTPLALAGPVAVGVVTGFLLRYTGLPRPPFEPLIWMAVVQAGTIALAAAVLRVAGYRLEKAARRPSETPE